MSTKEKAEHVLSQYKKWPPINYSETDIAIIDTAKALLEVIAVVESDLQMLECGEFNAHGKMHTSYYMAAEKARTWLNKIKGIE